MSGTRQDPRIDHYSVGEDLALEALLSIERAWERAHRGVELATDRWGEGPSRLRLADLGLDARLRTHTMLGVCYRHGAFPVEWTGLMDEEPPHFARCTAASEGERCPLSGAVSQSGRLRT